ncbi:MAG: glycosyl hydrolase family 57, partial [Gammaproteobacteria bacterium]
MDQLAEYVDGLPNISGSESVVDEAIRVRSRAPVFWRDGAGDPFAGIDSAYAIALHMHQPLIPAGGDDLRTAR